MNLSVLMTVTAFFTSLVRCSGSVAASLDENSEKVALYSYNIAGFFRKNDFNSQKAKDFQSKVANDIKFGSKDAWMYIFAYQEIWNAGEVVQEQGSIIADWFRKDLKQKIFEFTLAVMKEAFADRKDKIVCGYARHETLMTVACRFFEDESQLKEAWIVEAFKYGWTERGGKTNGNILGFKGILAVSIALEGDKNLVVINVHLSSKNLEDRWKGVRIIKDLLREYLYSTEHSILIVGDFNARSFSLVSPSVTHEELSDFGNNVGAGFLLLCLTDSLTDENFRGPKKAEQFCKDVLEYARQYDEISFFFSREFSVAKEPIEVRSESFKPTFCFNFEHDPPIGSYLGPKAGESIPSFTDRIFYIGSTDLKIKWLKYTDIPGPAGKVEFSDHRPIIGVFEVPVKKSTQREFSQAKLLEIPKTLPSEKDSKFGYREKKDKDWKYPSAPAAIDPDSAYLYSTYQIPNYAKLKDIDHNKMLKNVHLKGYEQFLAFAKKMLSSIEQKKNRIVIL